MTQQVAFIIDNDREFRARVSMSLRRDGFRVRAYSSARAALLKIANVLARATRRVVLLNLHTHDLAGLKLLSGLRDAFIVVSSVRDASSRARATDLGTLAITHRRDTLAFVKTLQHFWTADVDRSPMLMR